MSRSSRVTRPSIFKSNRVMQIAGFIAGFTDKLLLGPPSVYAFLAGISLSLAANLLTGMAITEKDVNEASTNLYTSSGLLFLSSLAFMSLTFPLESARSGWKREESRAQYLPGYVKENRHWLYPILIVAVAGLIAGLLILFWLR